MAQNDFLLDEILILIAMFGVLIAGILLVLWVAYIVSNWFIFEKAGMASWRALVPFYDQYTLAKVGNAYVLWLLTIPIALSDLILFTLGFAMISWVLTLANFIVWIIITVKVAKSFGKGVGFILGLIFLPVIFSLILAFDKSEHVSR